jgi:imidazolonepropionase-like amidohydrolase
MARWKNTAVVRVPLLGRLLIASVVAASACARTSTPSTAPQLAITGGLIFDGTGAPPAPGDVLIRDGKIEALRSPGAIPADYQRLDARGRFVMPGLIDAHTHMLRAGSCGREEGVAWENLRQIPLNFDVALAHGTTTVVDLGGPLRGVVAMRERLRTQREPAPRYLVAGPLLTAPNGYPLDWAPRAMAVGLEMVEEIDSAARARAVVGRLAQAGVDMVKIASMDVSYNGRALPVMSLETFRAVVGAAHARSLRVFVHAHTADGYQKAVDGGADVIAHSSFEPLSDAVVAEVARRQIPVIPTLWVFAAFGYARQHPEYLEELRPQLLPRWFARLADFDRRMRAAGDTLPDDFLPDLHFSRLGSAMQTARDNLARLSAAGARFAFGTDTSFCYALHGSAAHEIGAMVDAGLSPTTALVAATSGSAATFGAADLGVLRAGAAADVLVLRGNPLEDLGVLARPDAVIAAGRIVDTAVGPPRVLRTFGVLQTLVRALYLGAA